MGRLTTHVLDTALGAPAKGLKKELGSQSEAPVLFSSQETNEDGSLDCAQLEEGFFQTGSLRLPIRSCNAKQSTYWQSLDRYRVAPLSRAGGTE